MPDRQVMANPFDSDVVVDPGAAPVDVPKIHEKAFECCRDAYERVASGAGSWSVLLYGRAGCGKTHLLSRLRRWLNCELDPVPSKLPALFVAVRMQTGRGMIWRHLRRRFAEQLLQPRADDVTQLGAILHRFAEPAQGNLAKAFEGANVQDCSEELMQVLEAYDGNRHRRLCQAWLKGDRLSESQLGLLNLPQYPMESLEEDSAEEEARMFVGALTRLAKPSPVVFCFDQIEALGLSQEKKNYGFFCQMGASLIDTTDNSLLISTINLDFRADLKWGARDSDFQRISKDQFDLQPLDFNLGRQLVDARLATVPEAAGSIDDGDLHVFFQSNQGFATPRSLIHEARRLFAKWQDKPVPTALTKDDFLSAEYERLWSESPVGRDPAETDAVLAHGLPIALQLLGKETKEKPAKLINLAAGGGGTTVQIAFGNHVNSTSLAKWLEKVQKEATPNLCIIRDARLGISPTAKMTRQRLESIAQAGGRLVNVEPEALAALDAMRHLLATATSGDLSLGGETVEGATVRDWLKRNLPKQVIDFAEELMGASAAQDWQPDALLDLLQSRKVMTLSEAIKLTEFTADNIIAFAKTHPDRICFFGGSNPVVCLAVAARPA
ncbi:MAG: AAA family ATPase [Rhodomicrobium sp.]